MNDSTNAIELDETNVKAYLRKGTALYNKNAKEEALKTFARGLEIDCKIIEYVNSIVFCFILADNDQLNVWKEKCEKDLEGLTFILIKNDPMIVLL